MDTIRERIIKAIAIKLERVRVSNQYATDCGLKVNREVVKFNSDRDLPCFMLSPGVEEATRKHGFVECVMDVSIEGHVVVGSSPSVTKEQIFGDTIKIMTDRRTIADTTAGLAEDVIYIGGGSDGHAAPADVSTSVLTVFQIKYRFKSGDPFSQ